METSRRTPCSYTYMLVQQVRRPLEPRDADVVGTQHHSELVAGHVDDLGERPPGGDAAQDGADDAQHVTEMVVVRSPLATVRPVPHRGAMIVQYHRHWLLVVTARKSSIVTLGPRCIAEERWVPLVRKADVLLVSGGDALYPSRIYPHLDHVSLPENTLANAVTWAAGIDCPATRSNGIWFPISRRARRTTNGSSQYRTRRRFEPDGSVP